MAKRKTAATEPKKKWAVSIPFTGYVTVEVEADDEEAAIAAAWQSDDLDITKAVESEFHEKVTEGNVCNAVMWEASAEEIEP